MAAFFVGREFALFSIITEVELLAAVDPAVVEVDVVVVVVVVVVFVVVPFELVVVVDDSTVTFAGPFVVVEDGVGAPFEVVVVEGHHGNSGAFEVAIVDDVVPPVHGTNSYSRVAGEEFSCFKSLMVRWAVFKFAWLQSAF